MDKEIVLQLPDKKDPGTNTCLKVKKYAGREEVISEIEFFLKKEKKLLQRLSYTALGFIRSYFFRDTIGDLKSDDVLHNVLEKIIDGTRKWNREKFPNILDFIRISMLSYVRNEKIRKVRLELMDICDEKGELEEWKHPDYLRAVIGNDLDAGLLDKEELDKLLETLRSKLKKDEQASSVFEKRLAGNTSNLEISRELDLTVREVENVLKRIRRKYFSVIREFEEKK